MPVIRVDFDDKKLKNEEVLALSNALQKIVSEVTEIEDVFVYANSSQITVKIAPIEVFIQMSTHKIKDLDALVAEWLRRNTNFRVHPVPWAPARYDEYLEQMHDWAQALRVDPDAVELAIFQEMSERRGNQWSQASQ